MKNGGQLYTEECDQAHKSLLGGKGGRRREDRVRCGELTVWTSFRRKLDSFKNY
jgi:hypothetical protein